MEDLFTIFLKIYFCICLVVILFAILDYWQYERNAMKRWKDMDRKRKTFKQ